MRYVGHGLRNLCMGQQRAAVLSTCCLEREERSAKRETFESITCNRATNPCAVHIRPDSAVRQAVSVCGHLECAGLSGDSAPVSLLGVPSGDRPFAVLGW